MPAIQTAFSDTPNADFLVRLMLTIPALSVVILSPVIGAIVDRFGRRTSLLVASTVLYGLAGGAGYVIDSLYVLLVSRAILGIAVGGIMVTTTTLITDYFSGDQRETVGLLVCVFGLMGAGYVIIGLSGTVLGIVIGLLTAGFGWGLLIPTANTWVSQTIAEASRGRALGGVSSMIFLGQFLSPILSQPVIERVSLTTTFEVAGAGMLLLAVVFVIGNRRYTSSRRDAPRPASDTE